jgi:hypothetical protein
MFHSVYHILLKELTERTFSILKSVDSCNWDFVVVNEYVNGHGGCTKDFWPKIRLQLPHRRSAAISMFVNDKQFTRVKTGWTFMMNESNIWYLSRKDPDIFIQDKW